MSIYPQFGKAYELMHRGAIALAEIEARGIRVDVELLKNTEEEIESRITGLVGAMDGFDEINEWKNHYGKKFNLDSNTQLAWLVYEHLGLSGREGDSEDEEEQGAVDEEALKTFHLPFLDALLEYRKLSKALNTYVRGLLREQVDGVVHPFFHLHLVQTYRGSSRNPNFQNQPVRDPEVGRLVRSGIIPFDGFQMGEGDYGGIEVKVSACYHHDPVMIEYITDKSRDMHRDMACQCYKLPEPECTKKIRYCGKNKFVFPQFYGDYFVNCARTLWDSVDSMELVTASGKPLRQHLAEVGLGTYPRFEKHLQLVEKDFWHRRFKVYTAWKDKHYAAYLQKGYFDLLTGFRCSGSMRRNAVINYPVQGAAFHCLLWSLIQLHRLFKREKMKTCIVGQIHDSLVMNFWPSEIPRVVEMMNDVMCNQIRKEWGDWIIVPLEIEIEVSPQGKSWFEKKPIGDQYAVAP